MSYWLRLALILLAAFAGPAPAAVLETGKFRLYKFAQPIGEETYATSREESGLVTAAKFEFTDRGTRVPLNATLTTSSDLTPQSFEIKGKTSRLSAIDTAVHIRAGEATIREGKQSRTVAVPKRFFAIAGYAPASVQMLLVRYWVKAGRPQSILALPSGELKIEPRGTDTVTFNGNPHILNRYSVGGVIWGHEMLWTDTDDNLVALISIDAEFDHFEAIREGYEASLGTFISRAAEDGLVQLGEINSRFAPAGKGPVAIVGGTLIDGTGRPPVLNSVVVMEGGRILGAGPKAKVKLPRGAERIDAKGKCILPGLWDMHAHFEQAEWGPVYLAAGVTTARDNANELEYIVAARDAIAAGIGLGPRLLLAGIVDGDGKQAIGVIRANNEEEARAVVRRYHEAGFEQVKIYSSVKPEVVRAIADEAHRLGMTVTGHVPNGMTAFEGVEAGMDMISHLIPQVYMSAIPKNVKRMPGTVPALNTEAPEVSKAVDFFRSHGTVLDPTMTVQELFWHDSSKFDFEPGIAKVAPELAGPLKATGVPSIVRGAVQPGFEGALKFLGLLHKAGVPIVVGTDQTVPGFSEYREMELFVQAGFTPMEAIQAATLSPARVMKLAQESGSVEPGKRADLIIVNGNPLRSISEIRKVETVFANGRRYESAALWRSVGFLP